MKTRSFSISKRLKSFTFALNGLKILLREEHNARIHAAAVVCVTVAGFLLHISAAEWTVAVACFGLVIALEAVNSAIENICDFVSPQQNETVRKVKDLSAAAVLIAAICAAIAGVIIFLPKIVALC
jgi:diacylglycerol kinase